MNDFLTLDEVAQMWRCTRRRARDVITKLPGFPELVPGSTFRKPLWLRQAVLEFAGGNFYAHEEEEEATA
jgi:hypothetical protein